MYDVLWVLSATAAVKVYNIILRDSINSIMYNL